MEKTFLDVIQAWPRPAALAADVGEAENTVKAWRRRRSIPPEHWRKVETAARKRGYEWVSIYVLIRAAELRYGPNGADDGEDQDEPDSHPDMAVA